MLSCSSQTPNSSLALWQDPGAPVASSLLPLFLTCYLPFVTTHCYHYLLLALSYLLPVICSLLSVLVNCLLLAAAVGHISIFDQRREVEPCRHCCPRKTIVAREADTSIVAFQTPALSWTTLPTPVDTITHPCTAAPLTVDPPPVLNPDSSFKLQNPTGARRTSYLLWSDQRRRTLL